MRSDAVDLRDFYRTSLGQMAQRLIRQRIREIWGDTAGMSVLGLGYATPYLLPFRDEAQRTLAVMPATQRSSSSPSEEASSNPKPAEG